MNELEKEAAIGAMLAKGALHLGKGVATKVAPAVGKGVINAGKFAVKHPLKATGAALTAGALIGTGNEAMKAAKKELEEPLQDPYKTDKIAAYDNRNQNQNRNNRNQDNRKQVETYMNTPDDNNFKYLPHIVGGVALGLGTLQAIKTGNPMAPINTVRDAGDLVFKKVVGKNLKKTPGGRVISGAINSANIVAKAKNQETIGKYINIKPYPNLDPLDVQEKVISRYMVNDILPDDITKKFNDFLNQNNNGNKLTRPEIRNKAWEAFKEGGYLGKDNQKNKDLVDSFVDYLNNVKYTDRTKLKDDQFDSLLSEAKNFFKENPGLKEEELAKSLKERFGKAKKIGGGLENINKGLGTGVAIGAGDFLFHAIGDKYFEEKDNNEVKKVLRNSYENSAADYLNLKRDKKEKYKTPQERANKIMKRASIEKEADVKQLAKEILVDDILRNMKRSTIFAATPILAGKLINRDLKGYNFAKFNDKQKEESQAPSNSNRIILEMPLNNRGKIDFKQISKVASKYDFSDELRRRMRREAFGQAGAKVGQFAKDETIDTFRQGIRALSWIVPPAAVYALSGRNLKGNLEKIDNTENNELIPLEPGKARIIIEQNNNNIAYNQAHNNGYFGAGGVR